MPFWNIYRKRLYSRRIHRGIQEELAILRARKLLGDLEPLYRWPGTQTLVVLADKKLCPHRVNAGRPLS